MEKKQAKIYNQPLNDFSRQMANVSHVGFQLLFASFIFIYIFMYLFIYFCKRRLQELFFGGLISAPLTAPGMDLLRGLCEMKWQTAQQDLKLFYLFFYFLLF